MAEILLVDDNPDLIEIYGNLLRTEGHVVSTAANGELALAALRERSTSLPELVLLDMDMPVLDGRGTAIAIRADEVLADLTVVALTSHELPDQIDQALDAGCDAFVVKPTNPRDVVDELALLLVSMAVDGRGLSG